MVVPRSGSTHDQRAEEPDDEPDRPEQLTEGRRHRAAREHRADPDAHRELRELRRLHADGTEHEPASGAVDRRGRHEHGGAEPERGHEQQRCERPEHVVVDPRADGEQDEPHDRVEALLDEEPHRVPLAEGRGRRGGAEDHHEPERDEPESDEDQQSLLDQASVRTSSVPHPGSFCTSSRNSSPRCSKLSNWSNDAHAGERSTTSPGAAACAAAPRPRSSVPDTT